jgi:hypothetical protein
VTASRAIALGATISRIDRATGVQPVRRSIHTSKSHQTTDGGLPGGFGITGVNDDRAPPATETQEHTMMGAGIQFHLCIEADASESSAGGPVPATETRRRLEVPVGGPSLLTLTDPPQVLPEVPTGQGAAVLEPVRHEGRSYLTMVLPHNHLVRVNSAPAPRVTVLRIGDWVRLDDGLLLRVALYNRPAIGPPGPELLGKECPLCRVPLSAETTVYVCGSCGAGMHCEGLERDEQDRLECARIGSTCPRCSTPINLTEGYIDDPSF